MRIKKFTAVFLIAILFSLIFSPIVSLADTVSDRQDALKAQLAQIEKEQKENQAILDATKTQSASLSRDITLLNAEIKAAELKIQAKNLTISGLGKDINTKTKLIGDLEAKIERGQDTLNQVMKKVYQYEEFSLPEILLSKGDLSDSMVALDEYDSLQSSMFQLFTEIRDNKKETETERTTLDNKRNSEMDAREVIKEQQAVIKAKTKEKNYLLSLTKNQEKTYASIVAQKAAQAAQIRAALFSLRDTGAIPFGKALEYASAASVKTGVRPAFLLAILTQESSLGKNVGSCYIADTNTGAGISVKSGNVMNKVMSPTRDIPPFLTLTKSLGMDPYKTLVSCPIASAGGWGGAMGPAQFIPSTWALFSKKIASALGISQANPWNPQDAFMASSIYLSELGAVNGSYTGERNAACRYYSGSPCTKKIAASYGDQVMAKAASIQNNMINLLSE